MKNVYFVLMDAVSGDPVWDTFCGAFATLAEAEAAASSEWNHLTAREQQQRVVSINHVEVEDDVDLTEAFEVACDGGGWYVDFEYATETKLWYAMMMDLEDTDWGTGSYNLNEALEMARRYHANGYTNAYVAVIEESKHDSVCVEEIHDIDD